MPSALRVIGPFCALVAVGSAHAQPTGLLETDTPTVRVRLYELAEPTVVAIAGRVGGVDLFAGDHDDAITRLDFGDEALVSRASNQLYVKIGEAGLYASSLRVEASDGSEFDLAVREGNAVHEARSFPGRLFVSPDAGDWAVKLVNELALEDYVASVVSSEYGFEDLEGSKAMAVIVRTYTLAAVGKFGSEYDHVDHTLSQVYRGSGNIPAIARQAAEETTGEVLTHEGSLVRAVYFSTSGGHTADNETVWEGRPLPYLRGKPDPYGASSPHARWTTRISRPQLLRRLNEAFGITAEGFLVKERSRDGRVASVDLLLLGDRRRTVSGNDFRILILKHFGVRSVRSTLFDARRDGDEYVFEGRGYGHGVGLSQWGAHDMAERGMSYREILDFYYSGARIDVLDDAIIPPLRPDAVATTPPPAETSAPSRRIGW